MKIFDDCCATRTSNNQFLKIKNKQTYKQTQLNIFFKKKIKTKKKTRNLKKNQNMHSLKHDVSSKCTFPCESTQKHTNTRNYAHKHAKAHSHLKNQCPKSTHFIFFQSQNLKTKYYKNKKKQI